MADIEPNFECEARTTYLDFLDHAQKSNQHYSCAEESFGKRVCLYHQMCSCQHMCMLAESFKIISVNITMRLFSPHPEAVL